MAVHRNYLPTVDNTADSSVAVVDHLMEGFPVVAAVRNDSMRHLDRTMGRGLLGPLAAAESLAVAVNYVESRLFPVLMPGIAYM